MEAHNTSLLHASVNVRYETAMAHLWFEEIISGDDSVSIKTVFAHIDGAESYANAMLYGSDRQDKIIFPVEEVLIRQQIDRLVLYVEEFRSIVNMRWDGKNVSGLDSPMDQRRDIAFNKIINAGIQVEQNIKKSIHNQVEFLGFVQALLLFAVISIGLLVTYVFVRFLRNQDLNMQSLSERQSKLNAIEIRYRALFEKSHDAIFLVHRETGKYLDANDAGLRLAGRTHMELTQLSIADVCPEGADWRLKQYSKLKRTVNYGIITYVHPDGSVRRAKVSATALDEQSVIAIARDVTEELINEKHLRRVQKMDAVGQLSGGIAHDFNNILGIILGNIELLEMSIEDKEQTFKRACSIKKSTLRASNLVNQLLSFSRKTANKKSVANVNDILQGMDALSDGSVATEVAIELDLSDDIWLTEIDSDDLKDAILNIVLNARDALPQGGKIWIKTKNTRYDAAYCKIDPETMPGEFVSIFIRDNGHGIPADLLEHVFEPFFTTKDKDRGAGLGLPMVFGFIQRSSGFIKIRSKPGIGTEFQIALPKSKSPTVETNADIQHLAFLPNVMKQY